MTLKEMEELVEQFESSQNMIEGASIRRKCALAYPDAVAKLRTETERREKAEGLLNETRVVLTRLLDNVTFADDYDAICKCLAKLGEGGK